MSTTWSEWWVLILAANGAVAWLLSLALVFVATAGPVDDVAELSGLERCVRRWSRIRGSAFAPDRAPLPAGAITMRFVVAHRPLAHDMWRANRGAFLPARALSLIALTLGCGQLLLVCLAWTPGLDGAGGAFVGLAILGLDLLLGIAALMSENRRWRRRAPFETQLALATLVALTRPKKSLSWSEARSRLARIERVLANRFSRTADRPVAHEARDSLWWSRVSTWGARLAALDVEVRNPGGDFGPLVADQVEAAHRAILPAHPLRTRRPPTAIRRVARLDPQERAGWLLIATVGTAVLIFAALAGIDFMRSAHTPLPSLTEVRSWAPAVGAMMTALSVVIGAIAWGVRRLTAN